MIGLLQRVSSASVQIDNHIVGRIERGILVFVGVEKGDTEAQANRLLDRILGYRVFTDDNGRMNLSVQDKKGGILLVPQFTLAADTRKGMRASFTPAADADTGEHLFSYLLGQVKARHDNIASGHFGADMQVSSINDGPVTFWLQARPG